MYQPNVAVADVATIVETKKIMKDFILRLIDVVFLTRPIRPTMRPHDDEMIV